MPYPISGKRVDLRRAGPEDASFILALRLDPLLGRHISSTDDGIERQRRWMRESLQAGEHYFIAQDKSGNALGTLRIYGIDASSATLGSFIFRRGSPAFAAAEALLYGYEYVFRGLGLRGCRTDVRKANRPLVRFFRNFGARLVHEDERSYFYEVAADEYPALRRRYGGWFDPAAVVITPKVSVCIPLYGRYAFLEESIAGVLTQTERDLELIVLDDASPDQDACRIVAGFQDPRLRYVRNPRRLGPVDNFNRGISLMKGAYTVLFADDDVMMPENLSKKVRALEEAPEAGLAYSAVLQIDRAGKPFCKLPQWDAANPPGPACYRRPRFGFKVMLASYNPVVASSVMARRECYETLGGYDRGLKLAHDYEMWIRVGMFYDAVYLAEPLIKYRWHDANLSQRFSARHVRLDILRAKALPLLRWPGLALRSALARKGKV